MTNAELPDSINLSQLYDIAEKDSTAEIELFMKSPNLTTTLSAPVYNSIQYLKDQAVQIYQISHIELQYQGETLELSKKILDLGIRAGDKCRIEIIANTSSNNSLHDTQIAVNTDIGDNSQNVQIDTYPELKSNLEGINYK